LTTNARLQKHPILVIGRKHHTAARRIAPRVDLGLTTFLVERPFSNQPTPAIPSLFYNWLLLTEAVVRTAQNIGASRPSGGITSALYSPRLAALVTVVSVNVVEMGV
jgi:hypothetical protein